MIDLNALNTFLTVAESGSFSEAGRKLNLSQPAISQAIQNLERQFGVELFVRQGRSVRITEAGQLLQGMSREILAEAIRLEESMNSLQSTVIGEMTIGCSTTSGKYLLPGQIARFRKRYPKVKINVLVSSRESVMKKLLSGEIPLGVSSKRVDHSNLEYQDFFTDEVILIVPANHPWARYRQVYPDDLLDEPMILREEVAGTREILFEGLRKHDILPDMLNVVMTLGNAEAIEMAVEEGIGIAFISRLAAWRGMELEKIVEVTVEGMVLKRDIYLARNVRLSSSRAQTEFWEFVKTEQVRTGEQSEI